MSLLVCAYAYVTSENQLLKTYCLPNNHLWASWTYDSMINAAQEFKGGIKDLADHLSVSTCFSNHQIVFLLICVQFRNSQTCLHYTRYKVNKFRKIRKTQSQVRV